MTSQRSNEERNRLRLQAWEQRNQETSQAKGPNTLHLFGQPYKTNKGDDLSNRIQRMLGSYEDNTTTEPFSVPSSLTFPLSSFIHHISEPPSRQVCHNSQIQKGPCANLPSTDAFNSPKRHSEEESPGSSQGSQLIHSSLQETAPSDNVNKRQFTTFDRPQYHGPAENTNHVNMQVSCKDTSSPLNRTIGMLHPQAFQPLLSYKQPSAAMTQKPTAYVRPMDGLDLVASESPELKPSPEHHTSLPDVTLQKSVRGKADLLPQFLETKTSELQSIEGILREMTCSWPPLLSGIHSPHPDHPPKPPCSVKELNPPKQEPSHSHQSSLVLSAETHSGAVDSVRSSDLESSKSVSESESGTDDPPVNTSFKSEPAPASMVSEDWQLDKLIQFRQQNYKSKSQWAQSPKLSPLTDGVKSTQATVDVFSPARETPNLLSLPEKTVDITTSQKESTEPSELERTEEKRNGGVSVHFDRTSALQEEEPKVTTEKRRHKQSKTHGGDVSERDISSKHKMKEKVRPEVSTAQRDQCKSKSSPYSDHASPACSCGKPKEIARQKKVAKLSQKDKCMSWFSSGDSKGTLSLIVKINLSFLSTIPRTSGSLETNIAPHGTKDDKPHKVTNSRKNDKEDQSCPKRKRKLQGHNPSLHTAKPENSTPSKNIEKRAKKNKEMSHLSSTARDSNTQKSKKHTQCSDNASQLNKEPVKGLNNPKKSSGKNTEASTVQKHTKESQSNRPLLKFEDRNHPVKHYIKEAKRLKHKADAEMDKLGKTFHYLDAALFFIESGIAMESDPQISMSSYTMFAETVELIKFVLKLSNSEASSPAENDFIALCLRCQALLQLAMFHHKQKTALTYSKTLTDHFNNSSQSAPEPSAFIKGKRTPMSPNNSACGSAASLSDSAVVPQDIGQVALTYVNITTLFLNAHDLWEKADEFVEKGSGLSAELDKVMGRLSLTSTMSSMVRYIKQGLHWLQMNGPKVK